MLGLNLQTPTYNPPYLLTILNIVFITGTFVAIAIVSAKSYLDDGSPSILLLGASALLIGFSAIAASWAATISTNANVTTFNISVFAASMLLFFSGVANLPRKWENKKTTAYRILTISYIGVIGFVLTLTALSAANLTPAFFTTQGTTVLRIFVLGFSIFMFSISCLIFIHRYLQTKSPVLFWYSLGLGCFALGLFGVTLITQFNDLLNWSGRITQYFGGLYLFVAIWRHNAGLDYDMALSGSWIDAFGSNRKQLQDLFSKMLNGFAYHKIIIDKKGATVDAVFLEVNDAFTQLTGLTKAKVVGRKVTQVLPHVEQDSANWFEVYDKVALTGKPVNFENFSKSLGKWFNITAYSPQKGYFITVFEDITARKMAEKEIASLAKFPMENPSVIMRVDQKGNLMFANPKAQGFLSEWKIRVEEELPELTKQKVLEALTSKKSIEFETNLKDEIYSFTAVPILAEGYVNLYGRSITKRKKAEGEAQGLLKLVQQERDRLQSLLNSINDEVWFTDTNKEFTLANPPAIKEFKLNFKEAVDVKNLAANLDVYYVDGSPRPVDKAPPLRALVGEVIHNEEEIIRTPASGELRYRQVSSAPVRDAKGNIIGSVSVVRDITDSKLLQKKLEDQTKNLEKLVEARTQQLRDAERLAAIGATAGMVGHDIRNPLQAIVGDIYLTKQDVAALPNCEEKQSMIENLDAIEQNITYIDKIVVDLQDYARALRPVAGEVDLKIALTETLRKKNIPKNIRTSCHVDGDVAKIMVDSDFLRRIVENLVTNAVQAMPKGGKLTVTAHKNNEDTIIAIEDTGYGIPEEIKSKLFTPMFTTKSKGQGFGLAVCKRLTEALGGTITFESELGNGTKFIVRLPPQRVDEKWILK